MAHWLDDDLDEEGAAPWALGDDDPELLDRWGTEADVAGDDWLDDQLAGLRADTNRDGHRAVEDQEVSCSTDGMALRRPAPLRSPRRRRADPEAAADLPAPSVPGYVRDRRGTWRYAATGRAVPGARDLTLRSLYPFPVHRGHVFVPVDLVRGEAELGWCLAWKDTLTTRMTDGRIITVLRVPATEWERRADVPIGLWAPELTAGRLLAPADVARLAGVTPATITASLSRKLMPPPVMRLGHTPVWSRPVIAQWLTSRPGQGTRPRR